MSNLFWCLIILGPKRRRTRWPPNRSPLQLSGLPTFGKKWRKETRNDNSTHHVKTCQDNPCLLESKGVWVTWWTSSRHPLSSRAEKSLKKDFKRFQMKHLWFHFLDWYQGHLVLLSSYAELWPTLQQMHWKCKVWSSFGGISAAWRSDFFGAKEHLRANAESWDCRRIV